MFFDGTIQEIGKVPDEFLGVAIKKVGELNDHWVTRKLQALNNSRVLKVISPTNNERIEPVYSQTLLEAFKPLIDLIIRPGEEIVYLDASLLPAKQKIDLHTDWAMMHIHSRRIHIPLITNDHVKMAFVKYDGSIRLEKMAVGKIYEVNNCMPHAVQNNGDQDRIHILADLIDTKMLEVIKGQLASWAFSPVINRLTSQDIQNNVHAAFSRN